MAVKRTWAGWKWVIRCLGNIQAAVLLTLTYMIICPLIAIPFKILADPFRFKKLPSSFVDASGEERSSLDIARKQ